MLVLCTLNRLVGAGGGWMVNHAGCSPPQPLPDCTLSACLPCRYNKVFVDAFWNSRRQSFSRHMYKLMSSWATVCDVWFLEPQVGCYVMPALEHQARPCSGLLGLVSILQLTV